MKKSNTDVPVLLIFMARVEPFSKVFAEVKKARPSKLFLYQDGPREHVSTDVENIAACRAIAEDIDWECEVHRFYQEKNVGCDPSEYIAQKWMFEHVDRGIILEDDDVPSQSFFPFCAELLERYKDDMRINMICGMNHLGEYDNGTNDSYFFSQVTSIWGWATWKRTIDLWDEKYSFLDNRPAMELIKYNVGDQIFEYRMKNWSKHKEESNNVYYESLVNSTLLLNSQVTIVPMKNLISNIGIAADSAHASATIEETPKRFRRLFNMMTYEFEFPLKHPEFVILDKYYDSMVHDIMGWSSLSSQKLLFRIKAKVYNVLKKIGLR